MHQAIGSFGISGSVSGPTTPEYLGRTAVPRAAPPVPRVTLCYAQTLDGCVAPAPGKRVRLSGQESLEYVHRLRSENDGIIVGVGTVIADDPRLTVRRVTGIDPQPVVVDTALRCPLDSFLIQQHPLAPWIAAGRGADRCRQQRLEAAGAEVFRLPLGRDGRVDLGALLVRLGRQGLKSVMVEGGAAMITSFLSSRLVDRLVVVISPLILGGLQAFTAGRGGFARLRVGSVRHLGPDIVIEGTPLWGSP